jgi:HSP20 family molecular chaperone IbpA
MTTQTKEMQVQETQAATEPRTIRSGRVYVPRADIYETADDLVIVADMPGVDEHSVDITLEKNVLTISGQAQTEVPQDYSLSYTEYRPGNYQRRFTLSNHIDHDNIQATVKNGVLRLWLRKAEAAKPRKINITAG